MLNLAGAHALEIFFLILEWVYMDTIHDQLGLEMEMARIGTYWGKSKLVIPSQIHLIQTRPTTR